MYKLVKINPTSRGFDIRENFWQNNFQLSLISPFKELYDRDESLDKNVSSCELWCIFLKCDPSYENKIYRLSEEDKKSAILSYYPKFNFEDKLIAECILAYGTLCLSTAARAFIQEEASLVERSELIEKIQREQGYTIDEDVQLETTGGSRKKEQHHSLMH